MAPLTPSAICTSGTIKLGHELTYRSTIAVFAADLEEKQPLAVLSRVCRKHEFMYAVGRHRQPKVSTSDRFRKVDIRRSSARIAEGSDFRDQFPAN